MAKIFVRFAECDRIEASFDAGTWQLVAFGCTQVLDLLKTMQQKFGKEITAWPQPEGAEHAEMLVRELILKAQGKWQYPYLHEELCHCRTVATLKVDEAILMGAHKVSQVSRQTSASTACGTCRPEVERIIDYRLGLSKDK